MCCPMTGRHQMRALGRKNGDDGAAQMAVNAAEAGDDTLDLAEGWADEESETEPDAPRFGWVAPALAVLTIAGWTGFFGWAH